MTPKLCITVTGRTMAELRQRRDEATGADLVELRVDGVEDPDAAAALHGRRQPVIFTCRAAWEGGQFRGAEEERRRLLSDAQRLGAEFVDVEWRSGFSELIQARQGRGVVLSMHDFEGVPADLPVRAHAMRATGAEVIKLAVAASRLSDSLPLLSLAEHVEGPAVLLAMGDAGLASRVLAARFRSLWTYAGDGIAPGQVPAARLCQDYGFERVTDATALYGVVGKPVMHSLSPAMHNAAFAAAGIDAVYLPLAAADFVDFLTFANRMQMKGASVTAPFKVDAFDCAAQSDALTRRTGAANTLRPRRHGWAAANTDVAGFLAPLDGRMTLTGRRATILGAGGAARAVAEALRSVGARVTIAGRTRDRAADIAERCGATAGEWPPPPGSWDLLVNATPVGTVPATAESPLPHGPFTGELVYDLVYNPQQTTLLRDAHAAGCQTISGLEMLVAQAERQFTWWTGVAPAPGVMRAAAMRALAGSTSGAESTSGIGSTSGTLL